MRTGFYTFLSSLPALLAVVVAVVFQLLRGRSSGRVTSRIVGKLRKDAPDRAGSYASLRPAQVERLLTSDQGLRKLVDAQDFKLLKLALRQEFVLAIFVNSLATLLFIVGIALFVWNVSRPLPLLISAIHLESDSSDAGGLAVDLDPLLVTWTSSGEPKDVEVCLENVVTGRRSRPVRAQSLNHRVTFPAGSYDEVLSERALNKLNRVRVIVQGPREMFRSLDLDLRVGHTILVLVSVDAAKADAATVTVAAMIDRQRVPFYDFDAKVALFPRRGVVGGVSLGDRFVYGDPPHSVADARTIDWQRTKVVYFGPLEPKTVRTELVVDDDLR